MAGETTVEIRMYYVGFGDAFRITVRKGDETWRMLVDCGVHSQGQARPMEESVRNIIDDLRNDFGGPPRLDVIVATHHHTDHVSGFAVDFWEEVEVGEVWVPFIEDSEDPDAKSLLETQIKTAQKLKALIGARRQRLAADGAEGSAILDMAEAFADNSRGKSRARNRLLSRNDVTTFANKHEVRYLPYRDAAKNVIFTGKCGVIAHILGPPRDRELLKKMDPPKGAGWLTLNLDDVRGEGSGDDDDETGSTTEEGADASTSQVEQPYPLFNKEDFVVADPDQAPPELVARAGRLDLAGLSNDAGLLAAASILEDAVNNTSLFFVLDVAGTRLLFPGDAQYGAWEHVRKNRESRELIGSAAFYKVGHHGSYNATPTTFIENEWQGNGDAMVPWGLVKQWADTIPMQLLVNLLSAKQHRLIVPLGAKGLLREDTKKTLSQQLGAEACVNELREEQWWSQLTIKVTQ
jgi:beta-lactamase superfamily II metal-dependent hydrolase